MFPISLHIHASAHFHYNISLDAYYLVISRPLLIIIGHLFAYVFVCDVISSLFCDMKDNRTSTKWIILIINNGNVIECSLG